MSDEALRPALQPKQFRQRVIELAARGYVFWFLNVYGFGKILGGQFYRRGRLPEDVAKTLLGDANGFDLAWTFMGYSFAYILFIGVAEIVGAWLLLWERTKLFGGYPPACHGEHPRVRHHLSRCVRCAGQRHDLYFAPACHSGLQSRGCGSVASSTYAQSPVQADAAKTEGKDGYRGTRAYGHPVRL